MLYDSLGIARFREQFEDNPSRPFSSVGYLERGDYYLRTETGGQIAYGDPYAALVEQYGEEDAKFIWESMHPVSADAAPDHVVFIEHRETAHLGAAERFQAKAEQDGKPCLRLEGDLNLIRRLIDGEWDPADFLVIEPGQQSVGVYDWSEIVRAQPT